jgi:hypothetical protein
VDLLGSGTGQLSSVNGSSGEVMGTSGTGSEGDERQERPVPLTRWQDWVSAAAVTLVAAGLVIADISDVGFRHWWAAHALTTSTVAGLLVLLITFLVANQVVRMRQARDRSRAVAAQAAILLAQASRASSAVSAALDGSGNREAASDQLRTYMIMLMIGTPVLIDVRVSRNFLEQAQHQAAEMARSLAASAKPEGAAGHPGTRLEEATRRLRTAAAPLLKSLTADQRAAASGDPAG